MFYYFSFDLFDLYDNPILVKLTRNKLFKVENYYLLSKWDGDLYTLKVYIEEVDKNKAEEELTNFVYLLNFLYGIDLTISGSSHLSKVKVLPTFEIIYAETTKNKNIKKIHSVVNKIKNLNYPDYSVILQSIKYYSRSLKLIELELHEDSFLTAFKPIELISSYIYKNNFQQEFNEYIAKIVPGLLKDLFDEEYHNENKDREINISSLTTLESILTQRRKISKTLGFLKLNSLKDEIGPLVRLRNKIGAHGNSGKLILGIDESINCQKVCKQIIISFLFDSMPQVIQLDCERKI